MLLFTVAGLSFAPVMVRLELRLVKGTVDDCCLFNLGDFGTIAGGLGDREWTSFRKGLAGEGALFNRFFSNWWFCGLVSLPEPLELSIIFQHRQGEDDGEIDRSSAQQNTLDRLHHKYSLVSLFCYSSLRVGDAHTAFSHCFI